MSSFYEYWIGQNIDYGSLWNDFDDGNGYIEKYNSKPAHLLRLTFKHYPTDQPLFNHEAIFKTIKGTFHDLKKEILSRDEYENYGPLFLYKVNRGSEVWSFLAELKPILLYGSALIPPIIYTYQKIAKQNLELEEKSLEITEKKLSMFRTYFPEASNIDVEEFIRAKTSMGRQKILERLLEQGLFKVEVSKDPFIGRGRGKKIQMIDLESILLDKPIKDSRKGKLRK